jgi:hypothetical protein
MTCLCDHADHFTTQLAARGAAFPVAHPYGLEVPALHDVRTASGATLAVCERCRDAGHMTAKGGPA